MVIGYARVSTQEQSLNLQIEALQAAGCSEIYQEKISGTARNRPELEKAIHFLRPGDVLIVWKTDRLGRTLLQLVSLLNELKEKGVHFVSLSDGIDTRTPLGEFLFHLTGVFAELERNLIKERTTAGLQAAKDKGRTGGRPPGLPPDAKRKAKAAAKLYADNERIEDIMKSLKIGSKPTLYRYLEHEGIILNRKQK